MSMRSGQKFCAAVLAVLTTAWPAAPALAGKKMMGEDLSNMIIEGESRLRVPPKPLNVPWVPEVYRDVPGVLQDNSLVDTLRPPAVDQPPVVLPEKSVTGKAASPWLLRIHESPVLILEIKAQEKKDKKEKGAEWTFLVKDSSGQVFYELRKKGLPPAEIAWDGFGTKGAPLRVGYDYIYSFSAVDPAGNPQRLPGKPFQLAAFRYERGGVVTSFHPETLFESKSSLRFSPDGRDYLAEMKDFLRTRYGQKVVVTAYEDTDKFALSRAQAVRDFLVKALDLAEDWIAVRGLPLAQGGGYRHVDIVVE